MDLIVSTKVFAEQTDSKATKTHNIKCWGMSGGHAKLLSSFKAPRSASCIAPNKAHSKLDFFFANFLWHTFILHPRAINAFYVLQTCFVASVQINDWP